MACQGNDSREGAVSNDARKGTKIWAHRGASAAAPENTMEAFRLAHEMGADGIELDVHLTADGEVVVAHDETISRCSNGQGRLLDLTLAELRAFDFSYGKPGYREVRIPTLAEVLAFAKDTGMTVNVELKTFPIAYEGIEALALQRVREAGMENRVVWSSFNHYSLMRLRELAPDAAIGLLYMEPLYRPGRYAADFGAQAVHPFAPTLLNPGVVEDCRANGIGIHVWTVDAEDDLETCARMELDAVITNVPDVARRVIGR